LLKFIRAKKLPAGLAPAVGKDRDERRRRPVDKEKAFTALASPAAKDSRSVTVLTLADRFRSNKVINLFSTPGKSGNMMVPSQITLARRRARLNTVLAASRSSFAGAGISLAPRGTSGEKFPKKNSRIEPLNRVKSSACKLSRRRNVFSLSSGKRIPPTDFAP
jgi:hypothetical protein